MASNNIVHSHYTSFHHINNNWGPLVSQWDGSGDHFEEFIIPQFSKLGILNTDDLEPPIMARNGEALSWGIKVEAFNAISRPKNLLVDMLREFRLCDIRTKQLGGSSTYRLSGAMIHQKLPTSSPKAKPLHSGMCRISANKPYGCDLSPSLLAIRKCLEVLVCLQIPYSNFFVVSW